MALDVDASECDIRRSENMTDISYVPNRHDHPIMDTGWSLNTILTKRDPERGRVPAEVFLAIEPHGRAIATAAFGLVQGRVGMVEQSLREQLEVARLHGDAERDGLRPGVAQRVF